MKILMFAGAGSVGKTALMEACQKIAEARGLTVAMHRSTTRETYAKAGLTNESDALKDPEFNSQFQHQVMIDNIAKLKQTVLNQRADLLIADRTPYDYISYYFSVFQERLSLKLISDKRQTADTVMEWLAYDGMNVHVIMLPYPTSWATDTNSSDGWRNDTTGKNLIWSSVVEAELADAERRLTAINDGTPLVFFNRLPSFAERGSVDVRAAAALMQVFPYLR